jgi:ribosomal protein L11 methylase PrmA
LALLKQKSSFLKTIKTGPWNRNRDSLAIAAANLGAENVLSLDLNPLCVRTARGNIAPNGLQAKINVIEGQAQDVFQMPFDLTIANLHNEMITAMLDKRQFGRS